MTDAVFTKAKDNLKRKRLIEIDRGTAIAITLVVVGHIVAREPPQDNEWYVLLKYAIYKFHMPFFMFLSGMVFQYTFNYTSGVPTLVEGIKKKFKRLMPGFLLFGSIIIFGKELASQFIHVDNVQDNIISAYYNLFFKPISSPSGSFWYIYVLFLLYLLVPILYRVFGKNLVALMIFSILLHFYNNIYKLPELFMLNAVAEYLMWFVIGILALSKYEFFFKIVNRYALVAIVVFFFSFLATKYLIDPFSKTVIGLTAIPAILSLTRYETFDVLLLPISAYTFTIYLMNTILIGIFKGILQYMMPWDGANFYLYFPILLLAGLVGPIIVYKYGLTYLPYISKISK
jgi:fucose 4-O-acetylase-like acetyltransferase